MPPINKPARYWPGKAPKGYQEDSTDEESQEDEQVVKTATVPQQSLPVIHSKPADRRLNRLNRVKEEKSSEDEEDGGKGLDHFGINDEEVDDEEVDDEEEERARIRMKALQRQKEEEVEGIKESSAEEDEDSDSDDSDSNEEQDLYPMRTMLKPVFIPKTQRETVHEREKKAIQQQEAEALRLKQLDERKKESQSLVDDVMQKELNEKLVTEQEVMDVDDTDGINEEEEYEAWRVRELKRIKRDRENREKREAEMRDVERRRNMADAEIEAENASDGRKDKIKKKRQFMQKYYHKGAFFNDDERVEEAISKQDIDAPTLEDKFDKSVLPAVMQVRNFGRSGQSKYTHLKDQDTTQVDSGWIQGDKERLKRIKR